MSALASTTIVGPARAGRPGRSMIRDRLIEMATNTSPVQRAHRT